jgi:papain like protease
MITRIAKPSVLAAAPSIAVTRRHFINGTVAALTVGTTAEGLLTSPSWAVSPLFDLKNFMTPVKDQDDPLPCNACTAFAVVATVEGTYNKQKGLSGSAGPDMDEMDLFTKATPGPIGGCATSHWWPREALTYCETTGLTGTGLANRVKIKPPTSLLDPAENVNKTRDNMKDWILNHGPVLAVMVQYEDFYGFGDYWFQNNGNVENRAVYSPSKRKPGRIIGGHVVSVVGFSANDYWLCKNSWGDTWNGDGYVKIQHGTNGGKAETYIDKIDVWGVEAIV